MTDREEARPPTRFGFVAVDRERLVVARSEEHTSELQSQSNLVCRLLLEKKKKDLHVNAPGSLGLSVRQGRNADRLRKPPTPRIQPGQLGHSNSSGSSLLLILRVVLFMI